MRMMRTSVVIGLVAACSAGAYAQHGGGQRLRAADRIERVAQQLVERLDLDEQQQAELQKLVEAHKAGSGNPEERGGQRRELAREIQEARRTGDEARVRELREQLRRQGRQSPVVDFLNDVEPMLREDQLDTFEQIRERYERMQGGRRDPLEVVAEMRTELELSDGAASAYDKLVEQLETGLQQRGPTDEQMAIIQELREAAEAGDVERIRALSEEIRELREREGGDGSRAALEQFFAGVSELVDGEQADIVARYREQLLPDREGATDARRILFVARRLDLSKEQRDQLAGIERDLRSRQRELRRDEAGLDKLNEEVAQQVRDLLNAEQQAEFDRLMERYEQRTNRGTPGQRRDMKREPGGP